MTSQHSKAVSKTHCYVYDPASHEECDMEDSSRAHQQNSASLRAAAEKAANRTSSSGSKNDRSVHGSHSSLGRDRSLATMQDRSGRGGGSSRSETSKDRGSKRLGDVVVLSDDSMPSSPKRRSHERQPRRSRTRSRSRSPHRAVVRNERDWLFPPRVVVKDHRYKPAAQHVRSVGGSSSRTVHSRSRDKRSRSRSAGRRAGRSGRRSRSRSTDGRSRHRSRSANRRRDRRRKSVSPTDKDRSEELQQLKERIKTLKEEITRTKNEKPDYSRHDIRTVGDRDVYSAEPQVAPPPPSYQYSADRQMPPDTRRSGDRVGNDNVTQPQQQVEYSHVPRETPRDNRSADNPRAEAPSSETRSR